MAEEQIGIHRMFGKDVHVLIVDGKCYLESKLPLVGRKRGELTAADIAAWQTTFQVALSKIAAQGEPK